MPGFAVKAVAPDAVPPGALVLRSVLMDFWPKRSVGWCGTELYMHSGSHVQFRGELIDPATNTVLLKFVVEKESRVEEHLTFSENVINRDVIDAGKAVGRLIGASFEIPHAK
jgi:hypothetical protein